MFEETPINGNDANIKNEILIKFCHKISEKVQNNKAYSNYLLKSTLLHEKLLITLNDAILIHENEEKYEICEALHNFKTTIINKN